MNVYHHLASTVETVLIRLEPSSATANLAFLVLPVLLLVCSSFL